MGAVNTTYTFTATDTITSSKMNNIIDQTTMTDEAISGTTLEVTSSGKLRVRAQGITSNELSGSIAIPAGAILPFAMNSAPTGWLVANGQLVNRITYSALFLAIGTLYGVGDNSTTFALPDLQGHFVRGFGTSAGSSAFGAKQTDMVGPHTHAGEYFQDVTSGNITISTTTGTTHQRLAIPNSTGTETRPKNIAMLYCIKW